MWNVEMTGNDRLTRQVDSRVPSLVSKSLIDPGFALVLVLSADGIFAKEETRPKRAIHHMHNRYFVSCKDGKTSKRRHESLHSLQRMAQPAGEVCAKRSQPVNKMLCSDDLSPRDLP